MELLIIFGSLGILLIIFGVAMLAHIYFSSVVVDAECINISSSTVSIGTFPRTHYRDAKAPVYRYRYDNREYVSSPIMRSNRPGYRPRLGMCKIRISRKHPDKVFSSEQKLAAALLIGMGALYLGVEAAAAMVLPI